MNDILKKLKSKFSRKEYRDAYVKSNISSQLAHQLRIIREARGLTQAGLADLVGTKQAVISRYEDSSYGARNINTLVTIANALDIAVSVKFQGFGDYLKELDSWTPASAVVSAFDEELRRMENGNKSIENDCPATNDSIWAPTTRSSICITAVN